ncbi:5' nucleotidase family protein [Oesophagostomum dentatum]|uniref:5' nucleotidase family protein n=1 Tax=Oesophagostomum dentatum TaxID=61180 RepID=A0A0B1TGJ2_OESDE|nr:5' nucleotidase family protein [Oesophagostomum dentatum]
MELVMSYMMGQNWSQLFDVVIVDGGKPKWFLQDSVFRMILLTARASNLVYLQIDKDTGKPKMGAHSGPLAKGDIYSRGCATEFIQQLGLAGKDILYVGDHIFGDVLKSKKVGGWRTLLIVPELHGEMKRNIHIEGNCTAVIVKQKTRKNKNTYKPEIKLGRKGT